MKKLILLPALLLGTFLSADSINYSEKIDVISSEPIYKTITTRTPYQECWDEEVRENGEKSPIGALLGGIAGGILGNQIGGGSGKTAATVGGAIVGTMVGNNLSEQGETTTSMQRRCVTKYQEKSAEKLVGYKNIGSYRGKTITKYSDRALDSINLDISVHY